MNVRDGILDAMTASRTTWAEEQAARFCGFPLTAETVFLRLKYEKGGEKEVCDLLLALRSEAIVLSLKHQEDPRHRTGEHLARWCTKAAKDAARELGGALKTIQSRPFWCDHVKRGRLEFKPGALRIRHAIACVETAEGIELPNDLPDDLRGIPVTYMTSSDLLNIVKELHSFADIMEYLDARLKMSRGLRRTIGLEEPLYSYYLLNDQSFDGCQDFEDVIAILDAEGEELERRIAEKHKADSLAEIIESVAYSLDQPPPDAVTPGAGVSARFAGALQEADHTKAQEYLCDLRLGERRTIGEKFLEARAKVQQEPQGFVYSTMYSDGRDFLLVCAVAKRLDKAKIFERAESLLSLSLAHHRKNVGMIVVEREGGAYVTMLIEGKIDSPEAIAAGNRLFGHHRITHTPIRLLPEEGYTTDP